LVKTYLVGGAVRDGLLGLPVTERDWVVVGADAAVMQARGFVAADPSFPVFLHPETGEEYALARREVKRGEGYRGFVVHAGPDITLEEDLRRRDLTINAMALDAAGALIDPFGGREDLDAGLLRHVSPAFAEDPVRVLRTARFAAKLGANGFHVAHATHRLMCEMVARGDMAGLKRERVWREMADAVQTDQPWRFFEVLQRCGALRELIPEVAIAMGEFAAHGGGPDSPPIAALKRIVAGGGSVAQRLSALFFACVDSVADAECLLTAIRAERETAQLLRQVMAGRALCRRAGRGDVAALFELARVWRAFDAGAEVGAQVAVCEAQAPESRLRRLLQVALPAARAVSATDLRARGLTGPALGEAVAAARRDAMSAALRDAGLLT
jgi:tRNA nucleotidyltransferase (CCA-adding enzyme)